MRLAHKFGRGVSDTLKFRRVSLGIEKNSSIERAARNGLG